MNTKECYEAMGANYENVECRFGSEQLVKRFALKFPGDKSYAALKEAMDKKEMDEAFRAAHTLKGLCLNLGFDNLYEVSAKITENLRAGDLEGAKKILPLVEEQYHITMEALGRLEA